MNAHHTASALTRRHFIITAATAAGGFAIGILYLLDDPTSCSKVIDASVGQAHLSGRAH